MFELIPWRRRRNIMPATRSPFELMDRMDRLFDDLGSSLLGSTETTGADWIPAFDVSETEDSLILKADLPGIDPKELDISVSGNVLTVRGERKQEEEEKKENFHRIERRYGSFARSVTLPSNVDSEKISANYKDGVIKLTLPKSESAKPKKIEIKHE